MSKAGKRLIESAQQALDFAEGKADVTEYRVHIPDEIVVKHIRENLGMSQSEFAQYFGFTHSHLTGMGTRSQRPTRRVAKLPDPVAARPRNGA